MSKIRILKTNRKVSESPYLTACKEQDGLLGNIEMNHQTDIDDILEENFYVDAGSNLKRSNVVHTEGDDWSDWQELADRIAKPGVIARLGKLLRP